MSEAFERETTDRLARIETKIDNGILGRLDAVEGRLDAHPRECPLVVRKAIYTRPVVVALIAAAGVKALDLVARAAGL